MSGSSYRPKFFPQSKHSVCPFLILLFIVADPDPGFGAFMTSGSGMEKYPDPGSGMNIPRSYHICESLETKFWVKNTYIL
jgi:hypothetical protein